MEGKGGEVVPEFPNPELANENQVQLCLSYILAYFIVLLFIWAHFYVLLIFLAMCSVFLVVLVVISTCQVIG